MWKWAITGVSQTQSTLVFPKLFYFCDHMHVQPIPRFCWWCEGSAKRRTVPLCCMVTSTDREKKKVYLWNVSKITPNRGCWLYTAKHTNDACFKGAAQKRDFRFQFSHKNLHLPKTTTLIWWMSKLRNSMKLNEISEKLYLKAVNSVNTSSFINRLLIWCQTIRT